MKDKLFALLQETELKGYSQFTNGTRKIIIGNKMIDLLNTKDTDQDIVDDIENEIHGKKKDSKKKGLAAKIKDKKNKKELKASKQSKKIGDLKCSVG